MTDSPKPDPHPTPTRIAFARAVKRGFIVRIGRGHWHNTITGRRADAAVAEFGDLLGERSDDTGYTRAYFTDPDGERWLDTYGKNGADT